MKRTARVVLFGTVLLAMLAALGGCGQQAEDSPYGRKRLNPATVKTLDNPYYQNIILPDELADKLARQEEVYVYFFSPLCPHCVRTTPIVVPLVQEMNIELKLYSLLEYEQGWTDYNIEGTPTIVHYVGGVEKSRIEGERPEADFRTWFQAEQGTGG